MINYADTFVRSVLDTDAERVAATKSLAEKMYAIFVGREDAYSTRHINKQGRKSYYPVCANKGTGGCQIGKHQGPCDDCAERKLMPLAAEVFFRHLRGDIVIGLYLINEGRVRVAAVDFDDHGDGTAENAPAPEDAPLNRGARFVDAARELGITAFLERSGGGKGAHPWIFFRDWVTAAQARKLMEIILRRAGLPTNVEIFPRQRDARKFGNLIGLPWQGGPERWASGSAFLDPDTLELLPPLQVMEDIEKSLLTEMEVMRIRKEHGAVTSKDDELPRTREAASEPPVESALTDNPIASVFSGCAAMRAVRDDAPDPHARHGRTHASRLALASILRNLPGGREEIHRILAEKCGPDYSAGTTDSQIDSLNCPPMLCETLQSSGICPVPCATIRERNNKSPIAFAYKRTSNEDGKVEIRISTDEKQMFDAALVALRSHPALFQRGGNLVSIVTTEQPRKSIVKREAGTPRIDYVPKSWIQRDLGEVARFLKYKNRGWAPVEPPHILVEQFYTPRYLNGIRVLAGVTESPLQRHDGSLITSPGYDTSTCLYYQPFDEIPPLDAMPTQADAFQARDELLEVVQDFPFESEHNKSAWLSMVLTYFARPSIDGATPLFLVDANVRGSGKSLLAQLAAIIMTGRDAATMGWSRDDVENKKALTAIFVSGDPVILFDNVDCEIGGAALNRALTSTTWDDRILGETRKTGRMSVSSLLMATSNNATFGRDTVRRVIHISLKSPHEHPEDRTDLRQPKIRQWVRENRPRLVRAALTILRAYHIARPELNLPPMAEYIEWTEKIRAPIVWLGMTDPLVTQKILSATGDRDASELGSLMDAMLYVAPNGEWATASVMLQRAEQGTADIADHGTWDGRPLREALCEHCPGRGISGLPSAKQFAGRLTHFRNRVMMNMTIVSRLDPIKNTTEWRVESLSAHQDSGGEEGQA